MDQRQKCRQFCKAMLMLALVLRLCMAGVPEKILAWLSQPNTAAFLIYLETGRDVRFSSSVEEIPLFCRESPPPSLPETKKPEFSKEDLNYVHILYSCSLRPDLQRLLTEPLDWDLTDGEPAVLILSTHTTESYTQAEDRYVETSAYRTLDEHHNMLSVGDLVGKILEENGICVIRDQEIHDYPSYNGSYNHARKSIQALLEANPTVRIVLDLHRDASGTVYRQLRTEADIGGKTGAQLMFVMGTDAAGLAHTNWEQNLSLALKLQTVLEREHPGIMRPLSLRGQRFNQDLCPGALLIEVGAAGNTRAEALLAAEALAWGIVFLAKGTAPAPVG